MLKFKLNLININLIIIGITLINNIFGLDCTFKENNQPYKISNANEASTFLNRKIGNQDLDIIIDQEAAKLAVKFMANNAEVKSPDIQKNTQLYLELIKAGQNHANSILNNKLDQIPGYNWKQEYNQWLKSKYKPSSNANWLDNLIIQLAPEEKSEIEKLEKLKQLRRTFLKSIVELQSYFYALAQTHMDTYTGFTEGTFSIIMPYKKELEKIKNQYLDLVLKFLNLLYPKTKEANLIGYPNIKAIDPKLRGILASNPYAYYRPNSHDFKDSIGIDLVGLPFKFNRQNVHGFDWMYKFKHILMGQNNDQFWWKPEEAGLSSIVESLEHSANLMLKAWERKITPAKESGTNYAKERPVNSIVSEFKSITGQSLEHINDIYQNTLNLIKTTKEPKLKELKNLKKLLEKKYSHLRQRWGQEIILAKEDFITSYLDSDIGVTLKQYLHYFIFVKRLLRQFQKHFNNNFAIKVILPEDSGYIKAPESDKSLLTIIGHRIKLQGENPVEIVKEELKKFSCLTQELNNQIKDKFNKETYDYFIEIKEKIEQILKLDKKDQEENIKYNHIFEA